MDDLIEKKDALREILAGHDDIIYIDKNASAKRIESIPAVKTKQIKYFDEDEKVWKIGEVIIDD